MYMAEKPKNRLTTWKEKAYSLLSLPDCATKEVLSRIGLLDRKGKERESTAEHEAGHALVYLLAGKSIAKAEVSRLRGDTCAHLNRLMGEIVSFNAGEVTIDEAEQGEFAQQHPDRNVLMFLAGHAGIKNQSFVEPILHERLPNGADEPWEDISIPYAYLQDRFEAIHHRIPTNQEITEIFHKLLNEIGSIFSEDRFARALIEIKELIKTNQLKEDINERILNALYANGLSPDNLADMQKKLFSINIDEVVQKHGIPNAA